MPYSLGSLDILAELYADSLLNNEADSYTNDDARCNDHLACYHDDGSLQRVEVSM